MGKYDKIYENYYKKIDSDDRGREKESEVDYDDLYHRNSGGRNSGGNNIKGTVIALVIPILALGGFGVYKYAQTDSGKEIYNSIMAFMEDNGIGIVSGEKESVTEDDINAEIEKMMNEEVEETSATPVPTSAPTSFVLDDENVEKVKSDDKYSNVVSALGGIEIKAKSEEGLVLSCQYKIIASSLSGVVEDVGENAEGHFLVVDHGEGLKTFYYNLPELNYVKGQSVKKGDKIAEIKEAKEIVFKIKENDKFVTPRKYADFIK